MSLSAAKLAGSNSSRGRVENDYYATPFDATRDILDRELLEGTILEPSCGEGHISKVIREYYPNAKIVSHDLIQREDKFNMGVEGGHDFMLETERFDNIITNPPFNIAKEFVEKALQLANKKVIIFAKLVFLEGKSRREMFENTPLKTVYVFSRRVGPMRNGEELDENGKPWGSTMAFAWFVWDKDYKGEPTIKWICDRNQSESYEKAVLA